MDIATQMKIVTNRLWWLVVPAVDDWLPGGSAAALCTPTAQTLAAGGQLLHAALLLKPQAFKAADDFVATLRTSVL